MQLGWQTAMQNLLHAMATENLWELIEMDYQPIKIWAMLVWLECCCIFQVTVGVISHLMFISVQDLRMHQKLLINWWSFASADIWRELKMRALYFASTKRTSKLTAGCRFRRSIQYWRPYRSYQCQAENSICYLTGRLSINVGQQTTSNDCIGHAAQWICCIEYYLSRFDSNLGIDDSAIQGCFRSMGRYAQLCKIYFFRELCSMRGTG